MVSVGEIGELALLERLRPFLAPRQAGMVVGVGDDGAVWLPPEGRAVVVTTDSLAEGSHFTLPLDDSSGADLGWRLLAVSLSDLAAMGAQPGPAFISLALPQHWPVAWIEALYRGIADCAEGHAVAVAGGNIVASPAAVLSSTCTGSVDPQRVLRRGSARAGWRLAVTGSVGAAAAARRAGSHGQPLDPAWRAALRPTPRLEAAQALQAAGVGVAIDVSDGLYVDAGHLLHAGEAAGLLLDAAAIPVAPGLRRRWPHDWMALAGGGEDYELLFAAAAPEMERALGLLSAQRLPATVIGQFDDRPGLRLAVDGEEALPPTSGHQHFAP